MTRLGLVAAALALGLTMATVPSLVPGTATEAVAQTAKERAEARAAARRARMERQRAARRAVAEKRRACRAEARAMKLGVVGTARAYTRCMRKS